MDHRDEGFIHLNQCQPGYECHGGPIKPLPCFPGTSASDIGTVHCPPCSSGTYQNEHAQAHCKDCMVGYYRISDMNGGDGWGSGDATSCFPCSNGMYQNIQGQAICLPCVPGKYQNEGNASSCKVCPKNTKSEKVIDAQAGASLCLSCGQGEKSDAGSSKCNRCDSGEAGIGYNGTCELCRIGQYRNASMKSKSCFYCPKGWSTDNTAGSTKCQKCNRGKYNNGNNIYSTSSSLESGKCVTCPENWLQEKTGETFCKLAPPGTVVLGDGVSSVKVPDGSYLTECIDEGCIQFLTCPSGWMGVNPPQNYCSSCPSGYSSSKGSISCQSCEIGKFAATTNTSTCTPCDRTKNEYNIKSQAKRCLVCALGKGK